MLASLAPLAIMAALIGPMVGLPLYLRSRGWGDE
jgi:hypothetical protein